TRTARRHHTTRTGRISRNGGRLKHPNPQVLTIPPTLPAGVEPDDGVSATSGINMALVISLPIGPKTRLIAFSILR
ncbi:hypothetical protein, partial [Mycobacterium avium]|uniref:hypothetical protein n=1 Tax=Mycobacterium avium TaxID=1764 RepID=UPI001E61FB67